MNTPMNKKTRRPRFYGHVVTLLVGVVVVLVLGGPTTQAQTTTGDPAVIMEEPAVTVESTVTIVATGTVNDPSGAMAVNGQVTIKCRRVIDSTGASPPLVVLDFDFSTLQGSSGTGKNQKIYVTGDNHATEIRPLQASDTIIVTAPYYESTQSALSAKSMLVTATLNFDISSGKLTGGSINVGNNVVNAMTVGTIAVM